MRAYDVVVIGGGILGCFAARNLRQWNVSVALLERAEDVCTGITRANSAVGYVRNWRSPSPAAVLCW